MARAMRLIWAIKHMRCRPVAQLPITKREEGEMQRQTCILTGFTVSHSPGFSAITMAADPLKKGTFSGTNSGAATFLRTYGLRGSYR
jgi:hypothetical protein